ncbi:MAG: class II aldolase/adducin family protein [Ruminiclostridium sp.]|nr:class II aldolase/adducin family protein [Ruminiclostridium sp.]
MVKQQLKEEVARSARLFWEKGLSPGNDSGDTSLRDAETGYIYICPRPNSKLKIPNWGVTKAEDIVVINRSGDIMEDTDILPTVEAPMHLHIYRSRPEINAIVHSHAVWSSAFAAAGKNMPSVLDEQYYVFGGEVVCAEYGAVGSEKLAENIVFALGADRMAALMRNHGAVCIGKDLEEAFIVSDFLEKCAQSILFASLIGGFPVLNK